MTKKSIIVIVCCLVACITVAVTITAISCSKNRDEPPIPQEKIELTISDSSIELCEDEVYVLRATTNSSESVKWSSGDHRIVSVSAQGRVIAKNVGETVVYAKVGNFSQECKVKVASNTGKSIIELEKKEYTLSLSGNTEKIAGTVTTGNEKSQISESNATFSSENEEIATVSADGTITPKSVGSTLIFITSANRTLNVSVQVYTMFINNAEEWNAMLGLGGDPNARYYVNCDIDFSDVEYAVKTNNEGNVLLSNSFSGYINGGGHTVKNITMPKTAINQSLFGTVVGFTLENIAFENVRFTSNGYGIAVRMMHHYNVLDEEGNVVPNKNVQACNEIKNVSLDFVYENNGIRGICDKFYGGGFENIFLNMRMADGKSFNSAKDYAFTKEFLVWYSNNYINDFIVLAENGSVNLNWTVTKGSLDVSKEQIYVYNNRMEACYNASMVLDSLYWSVVPGELPKLK